MSPQNHDEHEKHQGSDSSPGRASTTGDGGQAADPQVIGTNDPVMTSGPSYRSEWKEHPDSNMVIETSRIREPDEARTPDLVMVPVEYDPTPHNRSDAKDGKEKGDGNGKEKGRKDGERSDGHAKQGESKPEQGHHDRDESDDRHGGDRGQPALAPSLTRILLFSGLVALVCGVVGAWGYSYFFGGKSKSEDQKQSSSGGKKSGGGSEQGKSGSGKKSKGSDEEEAGSASNEADTIPGFTTAEDADSLRKQIGHVTERLDALQHRLDQIRGPRDQTPPDLHTLQIKMGELSRTVDEVADLPSRVRRMTNRLEELEQQIKMVKDRQSAREDSDLNKPVVVVDRAPNVIASGSAPPGSTSAFSAETDAPDAALKQAIQLFKLGQYPIAANILTKLRETRPDDARVWYFSALVNGLTTGQWDGETRRFAERGAEMERAGIPSRPAIDRALSGVTPTQGGDWLGGIRGRISKRS